MKFWKDAKEAYRSIQPPEELEETIRAGVRTAERIQRERRQKSRPVTRYAVCGAAALCMIFVVAVNASPVLAKNLYDIPVVGNVARVFTFVQMEKDEGADTLIVNLPALENTGNDELERRINYEIQYEMNALVEEARQRAQGYKEAYVATGGREEDFIPVEIFVDYRLHCNDGDTVSFVITKAETQATYYEELFFYNIDLQTGKDLTLRDLLGRIIGRSSTKASGNRSNSGWRRTTRRSILPRRTAASVPSQRIRAFISTSRAMWWWCSSSMRSPPAAWAPRNLRFCPPPDAARHIIEPGGTTWFSARRFFSFTFFPSPWGCMPSFPADGFSGRTWSCCCAASFSTPGGAHLCAADALLHRHGLRAGPLAGAGKD